MEICLYIMKKIKLTRGDALGGALPLAVMKAPHLSEMKPSFNKRTRRRRGLDKRSISHYLILFLIFGFIGGLIVALLAEGPKF